MRFLLVFGALFALSPLAQANDRIGNGGGLWACWRDNSIVQAELVDLFEAKNEFQLTVSKEGMATTPSEIFAAKIKLIKDAFPSLPNM